MSADGSLSEDAVSSLVSTLGHSHTDGIRESRISVVSSEDTLSGFTEEEQSKHASDSPEQNNNAIETPTDQDVRKDEEDDRLSSRRCLPFINPSSVQTLKALVQQIQSSSDSNPELWRSCQGRWLHLFQLVEKQYQDQIFAQQEQYQSQIQLIQDEIKALVLLQSGPQEPTMSPGTIQDLIESSVTPEEALVTGASSGYGTLWEPGGQTHSPEGGPWVLNPSRSRKRRERDKMNGESDSFRGASGLLTSWAQRQRQSQRRRTSHQEEPDAQVQSSDERRRMIEFPHSALGLSYWRLEESQLYQPLPDELRSSSCVLAQALDARSVSLREIYQNKIASSGACNQVWSHSSISSSATQQALTVASLAPLKRSPSRTIPSINLTEEEKGSSKHSVPEKRLTPQISRSSEEVFEDPAVLSLLRQGVREKHTRHLEDLRAYYESEISELKEKLCGREPAPQHALLLRCQHLDRALTEASRRIRQLEINNTCLEQQLSQWPERCSHLSSSLRQLNERLDQSECIVNQKDELITELTNRVQRAEGSVQSLRTAAEEHQRRAEMEHALMQDLLSECDSLRKEHQGTEVSTPHTLLECLVKILMMMMMMMMMVITASDQEKMLLAEEKLSNADEQIAELRRLVSKLEAQVRQLQHQNQNRIRQAVAQPSGAGLFHHPDLLLSPSGKPRDASGVTRVSSANCAPEEAECLKSSNRSLLTPVERALNPLQETRGSEEQELERLSFPSSFQAQEDGVVAPNRSVSPECTGSSSLLQASQRRSPACCTPSKRQTLLAVPSVRSSPKRCPTENFSCALGRLLPSHQHRMDASGERGGQLSSPRSRPLRSLPYRSPVHPAGGSECEEQEVDQEVCASLVLSSGLRVKSLTDAERLLDQLSLEKQQIEAALSRIPGAGGRVSLEKRLHQVDRELGSIRMTLKRFHILRSSAS
ncbi:hypothetical protein DNTS_032822 [Danionella cerebrum]|uniref:M-phase phosphoprotein 9 n=1 Tax=Danionella cerebrum TaxID=2873325 RepID=A0A553QW33_9TELE|nr:hypothetical protein DNTS_032822 [Danionella translucida]